MYVAAVDGNGGAGKAASDQDPYGDDTAHTSITFNEHGASSPGTSKACSFGGSAAAGAPTGSFALLALLFLRRQRRTILKLSLIAIAGCNNGPLMTPGQDCMNCHVQGGTARSFTVAGTVFASAGAPTFAGLDGVDIHLTDARGTTIDGVLYW